MFNKAEEVLVNLEPIFLENETVEETKMFFSGDKRKQDPRQYLTVKTSIRELFVKIGSDEKSLQREFDALKKIGSSSGFLLARPLHLFPWCVITSYISGIPLDQVLVTKNDYQTLKKVVEAIAVFHEENANRGDIRHDLGDIYLMATGKKLSADTKKIVIDSKIGGYHGDLDPFNVLLVNEVSGFALIDWEDYRSYGMQELDILHFISMLSLIENPEMSYSELYDTIFSNSGNLYSELLKIYCQERKMSFSSVLKFIPVYCDAQNFRLKRAGRDTDNFLYNDFKKKYYVENKIF
jgi:hypothetical protein